MLQGWKKTDLPHDYSIEKGRDPHSPAGLDEGFFGGAGLYYKKTFLLQEAAAGKQVWLEFEGISGMTEIWVNKKWGGGSKHHSSLSEVQCFEDLPAHIKKLLPESAKTLPIEQIVSAIEQHSQIGLPKDLRLYAPDAMEKHRAYYGSIINVGVRRCAWPHCCATMQSGISA